MDMQQLFLALARYNRWMNEKLYAECAKLSDEERKRERGTPFHSLHGLLNHLLLADRIWLGRFERTPFAFGSLDEEQYSNFEALRTAREAMDERIAHFAKALTEEELEGTFTYTSVVKPEPRAFPYWVCVMHLFNHQTHHRGQLTALLEQSGGDCGVTDLLMLPGLMLEPQSPEIGAS